MYSTVAAGDPINASTINDLIAASINRPSGRLVQAVAQSGIVNNTMTAVTFTTEVYDTNGWHSTVSNTSRVTPTVPGIYRVKGSVAAVGATDYNAVEAVILDGGSPVPPATRFQPGVSSQTTVIPVTADVDCNGTTDYFELGFRLNRSGAGTSGTVVSAQFASVLEWTLLRGVL
jgi:hypothetical protein